MISVSSDLQWITFKVFANASDVIKKFIADDIIDHGSSVLGTEDDVNVIAN